MICAWHFRTIVCLFGVLIIGFFGRVYIFRMLYGDLSGRVKSPSMIVFVDIVCSWYDILVFGIMGYHIDPLFVVYYPPFFQSGVTRVGLGQEIKDVLGVDCGILVRS